MHPFAYHAPRDIGCVILGAGRGSRFGGPKVAAEVRPNVRFLDEIVRVARAAGLEPIVAVVPPGTEAPTGVLLQPGGNKGAQQIHSVCLGLVKLANLRATGALIWPVDHPYVTLASIATILDAAARTDAPIVIPTFDTRRGHPTFFARGLWRELCEIPAGGARAVVHAHASRVHEVPVPDEGVLRDVDTAADLRTDTETIRDAISGT